MEKRLLIISSDILREGEPQVSYGLGCLMASIRKELPEWHIDLKQLDAAQLNKEELYTDLLNSLSELDLMSYDAMAISAYVWNEFSLPTLLKVVRAEGYRNRIILGGYQITYANEAELPCKYPEADIFLPGNAERSILEALKNLSLPKGVVLKTPPNFKELPSPYLDGSIPLDEKVWKVRMETMRGCPYACSFCAHRDLSSSKRSVHRLDLERSLKELALFKAKGIRRVNVLDPIFNTKPERCQAFVEAADHLKMSDTQFTFQCRLELLSNPAQDVFLNALLKMDAVLEFGLQTIIEKEGKIINRQNNVLKVKQGLKKVNQLGIPYEVSLIYGLPTQTVASFRQSIDFLRENGCERIVAFPLMLLRGTSLAEQKAEFGLIEKPMGEYQIPTVVESNSFSETEWNKMREIAHSLGTTNREGA